MKPDNEKNREKFFLRLSKIGIAVGAVLLLFALIVANIRPIIRTTEPFKILTACGFITITISIGMFLCFKSNEDEGDRL